MSPSENAPETAIPTEVAEKFLGLTPRGWNLGRAYALLRLLLDAQSASLTKNGLTPEIVEELKHFAGILVGLRDVVTESEDVRAIRAAFESAFSDIDQVGVSDVDVADLQVGKYVLSMRFEIDVQGARMPLYAQEYGLTDGSKNGVKLVLKRVQQALMSRTAGGPLIDSILVAFPPDKVRGMSIVEGGADSNKSA